MTDIEIENQLLSNVQTFRTYCFDQNLSVKDGIYTYLTAFGIFLRDAILKNETVITNQSFIQINELLSYGDENLDTQIKVGIFEILTDFKETQIACSKNLNQKGLKIFESLFDRFQKLY